MRDPCGPQTAAFCPQSYPPSSLIADACPTPEESRLADTLMKRVHQIPHMKDEALYRETSHMAQAERSNLRASELVCLMVAYVYGRKGRAVGYAEVIDFSFKYMPKPLADGTVCKTFASLQELGCLTKAPPEPTGTSGRHRELFFITDVGIVTLQLALVMARHLYECRRAMAS